MADTRRVAVTRKVSLAEYADDWDDCFVIVSLANYEEYRRNAEMDFKGMKQIDVLEFELKFVTEHFVSGKIKLLKDVNQELVDMVASDISSIPALADRLYLVIMGVTLDPKDLKAAAEQTTSVPSTSESNTKTSSSTDSTSPQPMLSETSDSSVTANASA